MSIIFNYFYGSGVFDYTGVRHRRRRVTYFVAEACGRVGVFGSKPIRQAKPYPQGRMGSRLGNRLADVSLRLVSTLDPLLEQVYLVRGPGVARGHPSVGERI